MRSSERTRGPARAGCAIALACALAGASAGASPAVRGAARVAGPPICEATPLSALAFAPAEVSFGIQFAEPPFPAVARRTLRITNTAAAPAPEAQFSIQVPLTGGNGFFTLPGGDFRTIGPGEFQDLEIEFRWNGGVVSTAPLVLRSVCDDHPPVEVPMFAEAAYGKLAFDAPPDPSAVLVLPAVPVGQTSTFTIRGHNDGHFELVVTDLGLAVTSAQEDVVEIIGPQRDVRLAPGAGVAWTLRCTPSTLDGASGDITFNYAFAASNNDTLLFFCPALPARAEVSVSPLAVDLGEVVAGTTARLSERIPGGIAITNLDAAATVTITGATLAGDPGFALIGPDRALLGPGERAALDVALTPPRAGTLGATIDIFVDGEPAPRAQVTLTATATEREPRGCAASAPSSLVPLAFAAALAVLHRRRRARGSVSGRSGSR